MRVQEFNMQLPKKSKIGCEEEVILMVSLTEYLQNIHAVRQERTL